MRRSRKLPKKLEQKLRKEANAKGLEGEHADAYVYGTMRKTGWKPSVSSALKRRK
jgi:hypothetical protein